MFRFNFNTKFGKDKKPIKIRPATQNTQRVEISIRNATRRKRSGSGPLSSPGPLGFCGIAKSAYGIWPVAKYKTLLFIELHSRQPCLWRQRQPSAIFADRREKQAINIDLVRKRSRNTLCFESTVSEKRTHSVKVQIVL